MVCSSVFAQSAVTVSGSFTVPPEIVEEFGVDVVLIDLDGSTGFDNYWADLDWDAGTFTAEVPPAAYGIRPMNSSTASEIVSRRSVPKVP